MRTVDAILPTYPEKQPAIKLGHAQTGQCLDTEGAAGYLSMSPATLETRRVRGGGPPFVKAGRLVLYRISDLDAWVADRIRTSTSQAA